MQIVVDDLSGAATQRLLAAHLAGMRATPGECVHALDLEALRHPSLTVWTVRIGDEVIGVGALKRLDAENAELKSMRVADGHRGTGAGRGILRHILAEARAAGFANVWLETGSSVEFLPARTLYSSEGFAPCGPYGDYVEDPLSVFMTRTL
ncbi:GNAT family N-acetyltransferase [Microbacterium telephonicum]|uniref:Putative acetyltransferase n=1 Tax=Microbacterium telephonicum TaxID=1714841 RepID=A0A498C297_9MICO|nr:GNAT family N-acetyltransferase [Microbacterium telephonicum]RLK47360.1 putative acetyltransferase [Microbacterium telephonicum]